MTVIDVLLIILIIAATALCIFIIFYLGKLNRQVNELQKEVKQIVDNTVPLLNNLNEVTSRANRIVTEAENYWDEIDRSIKKLKEKASNLTSLSRFRDEENPTKDLIKNLRALFKGISTFWREFNRK